jgi:hypothetical protein
MLLTINFRVSSSISLSQEAYGEGSLACQPITDAIRHIGVYTARISLYTCVDTIHTVQYPRPLKRSVAFPVVYINMKLCEIFQALLT